MIYAGSIHSRELVITPTDYPIKLYNFKSALDIAFPNRVRARQELLKAFECFPMLSNGFDYSIAATWGYLLEGKADHKGVKAFDVFSYKFDKPWVECNPSVNGWCIRDLSYSPDDRDIMCETLSIILGKEAELRRRTSDKKKFLKKWPNIGELGPLV